MKQNDYSAGTVKLSFWFSEFRKVIQLINSGKTMGEIKTLNIENNIFGAPTTARSIQIFNAVSSRIGSLDESFYKLFEESNVATQKIINLISIMNIDSLFFDFVYEVYREKLIMGTNLLTDADVRIFFKNKQIQSEKVSQWKDYTIHRLGTCYKTFLMEAGITDRELGDRAILKPILDIALENHLKVHGMTLFINALTGVR